MSPLPDNHNTPGQVNRVHEVDKDDDRVNISISRKAYDALLEHTK
jgi:hypothetical protein